MPCAKKKKKVFPNFYNALSFNLSSPDLGQWEKVNWSFGLS